MNERHQGLVDSPAGGMACPHCQHRGSAVVDSRFTEKINAIRRRRYCEKCKGRYTTYERVLEAEDPLLAVKQQTKRILEEVYALESIVDIPMPNRPRRIRA
jgi:transcriptional regulator NrdR family protein